MMPFALSLRPVCRIMLGVWLVLLVVMSGFVAQATRTPLSGNLLAFLLSSPQPAPVMPRRQPLPDPEPTLAKVPVVPEPVLAPPPGPVWTPIPRGKKQGSGALQGPEITQLPNGSVEVIFTYAEKDGKPANPGEATALRASARATSVDLHGPWKRVAYVNKVMGKDSFLSRVQVAEHAGYVRVSATAHSAAPLERTEYTADRIRITFFAQNTKADSGATTISATSTPFVSPAGLAVPVVPVVPVEKGEN